VNVALKETKGTKEGKELLARLVQFCQVEGKGDVFAGWPAPVIEQYLAWHASFGTLAWAADGRAWTDMDGHGRIVGVGVLYPCDERELRDAHATGETIGCFAPPDWSQDSVYLADFVVSEPRVLGCLLRDFWNRFPQGRGKKWFCHRAGKLVQLNGTKYVGMLRKAICGKY